MPKRFSIDDTWFNAMFYGESGVGKTVLSASAIEVPELCPVLLVDVEGGTLSLANTYPDIDVEPVRAWAELPKLWRTLYDNDCTLENEDGEPIRYNTAIIDTTSEAQRLNMRRIMAEVVTKDTDRDPDIPSQREYGKNLEQMRAFFRQFRDLPMNMIFTAHAFKEKDERTGSFVTSPGFTGKMSTECAGYIDEVLYLSVRPGKEGEPNKRVLLTDKTNNIIAKDRSGRLDRVIENPTMSVIYSQLRQTNKARTTQPQKGK